ncbi:MAG: porin family protein [Deltaproteobacteria bacterium]|nr:porin family protein [Deltaproteobacteria bacterium]
MRRILIIFTAALIFLGFSLQGVASAAGEHYVGFKTGFVKIDPEAAGVTIDAIIPVGVLYGYNLTPDIAVEVEVNFGVSGGDVEASWLPGESGEVDVWTGAVYIVAHPTIVDKLYLKLKAGMMYSDQNITFDTLNVDEKTIEKDFHAWGGLGYKATDKITTEIEYTSIDDTDLVSIGVNYLF